ncbi:UDP-glucose 4-epimerase [Frigoribacterium sp. 9N]|nr:UDP-glucose 4-epimerase [Frigoribacterium sp. 9N]
MTPEQTAAAAPAVAAAEEARVGAVTPAPASGMVAATPSRVDVSPEAAAFLVSLTAQHGPLMFHQSGGCCDGSSPMCYPVGFFRVGAVDVHLGDLHVDGIDPIEVYMSRSQFEYWKYTHLTIDVVPGRGAGFSIESPEGRRFLIRSRLLDDDELRAFGLDDAVGDTPA